MPRAQVCPAPLAVMLLAAGCHRSWPLAPETCLNSDRDATPLEMVDLGLEAGIQDASSANMGFAAEDFDGDGDIDVYVANTGDPSVLYLNDGGGRFLPHPNPPSTGVDAGASAVDYDNDGDADLYLSCGGWGLGCPNGLYRNDGEDEAGVLIFTDVSAEAGIQAGDLASFGGAWADYDGDGWLDLFQASKDLGEQATPDTRDRLLRNNGDGTFTEVGEEAGITAASHSHQGVWLDHDDDGDLDLYVPNLEGHNPFYVNNGDGTFTEDGPRAFSEPYEAFGAYAADFDNDGWVDLFVNAPTHLVEGTNSRLQDHQLFLNDRRGGWVEWSREAGLNLEGDTTTWIGVMGFQGGDLDLDGFPELAFGAGEGEKGMIDGLGSAVPHRRDRVRWVDRSEIIDAPPPNDEVFEGGTYPYRTHGFAFADFDADGDVDLLVGSGGVMLGEPNRLFSTVDGPDHHAVRVTLEGVEAPRSGVGARVRVADGPPETSTWEVWRGVMRSAGFNSSQPASPWIGVGRCEGPYHVSVHWPGDGGVDEVSGVISGEEIVVVQGG